LPLRGKTCVETTGGAKEIIGQTVSGRYLKIVFRFVRRQRIKVITAYDLSPKAKKAFRRKWK
jgi:hypothetical protein